MKRNEEFNASYEELGIPDDEYFQRLTPRANDRRKSDNLEDQVTHKPSSTAMATHKYGEESDEEMLDPTEQPETPLPQVPEETKLHSGVARQPTIVHRQQHAKSREGLLNDFQSEGESAEFVEVSQVSPEDESPERESDIQRATSVNLKHHVRNVSAGSAKLLNIPAKGSKEPSRETSREILATEMPTVPDAS